VWDHLPREVQGTIIDRGLTLAIDAQAVADETG
jgi:hypothetical protein